MIHISGLLNLSTLYKQKDSISKAVNNKEDISLKKLPVQNISSETLLDALKASRGVFASNQVRFGEHSDSRRFDDLVKGKHRKEDIFKYIAKREMIVDKEGKIRFPMPQIDQPDFRRDESNDSGDGQGMGQGEVGDEVQPGQEESEGEEGEGKGKKAGNDKGKNGLEQWGPPYSPSDIAKLLGEELKLPNLQPKSRGKMREARIVWNSRHPYPPGRKLLRPTMMKALKRQVTETKKQGKQFDPHDIEIIPPDVQRLAWKINMKPTSKTVIFYLMDVSGSISETMKQRARTSNFILSTYLKYQYGAASAMLNNRKYNDKEFFGKGVEERFIIHSTKANEVPEKEFYTTQQSGGTNISSAFTKVQELINKQYPPNQWNIYIFYYGDGENWGDDTNKTNESIEALVKQKVNLIGYVNLNDPASYGMIEGTNYKKDLAKVYGDKHNTVRISDLVGDEFSAYKEAIKPLLEERTSKKGKK